MWLRILGLPDGVPRWWNARNMDDADGPSLDGLLRRQLPGYHFSVGGEPLAEVAAEVLHPGSTPSVVARPSRRSTTTRGSGPEVVLVTDDGPDAGLLAPLPRSGLTVGRNHAEVRIADPFMSGPHFQAVVDPEGVRIVRLAGTRARPDTTDDGGTPQTGSTPWRQGSTSFRLVRGRPEPLPTRTTVPALTLAPGPEPTRPNALLQAVMALGPLVIGVALAVVTGHWYFLLFSLISVGVAGTMWGQHRAARAAHGRRIAEEAAGLGERLEALAPAPGALALAARSAVTDRFGTRAPVTDPPLIRWGTGTTTLPLSSEPRADWSAWTRTTLPVLTELRPGGTTRVTGQRSTLEAISHWLLVQLCRDAAASSRGLLVRTTEGDAWFGGGSTAAEGTAVLPAGVSGDGIPDGWHRVLLCSTEHGEHDRNGGDRLFPDQARVTAGGLDYDGFRWHGMSAPTAGWLVEELGASHRPRVVPPVPRMELPLQPHPGTATGSLRSPLTGDPDPVHLDLVRDGPHALIAGTTGSGKSELLLTVLTGLAAAYPPGEVSFVLMDFKGGSSFAPLAGLPHTMSVETNLVEAESLRTVDALTAELRRREELFLSTGSVDYAAFRRSRPREMLPRLVVAIDELRVLVEDHPQSAAVLARLAATGRSLGFHLVLATQRAQGAVGPDVRSNLGTVVCLRTATEQESWDLLGCPDAHAIDPACPGKAFIRHGGAPPRAFQAGRFAGLPGPPELVPWDGNDGDSAPVQDDGGPADWPGLVDRIRRNSEQQGLAVPETVVMPALPDHWNPTATERLARPGAVIVGLADFPGERRQEPVTWAPGRDGPVAWIGTDAGRLPDAARSLLRQLAGLPAVTPACAAPPRIVVLGGNGDLGDFGDTVPHGTTGPAGDGQRRAPEQWTVLSPGQATPERLGALVHDVREDLAAGRPVHLVVTAWGRWAGLRVGTGYETAEEHLALLLRDHPPALLAAAFFGGRELAGGRVLGQVPHRFYLPAGSTPEQRMVWPTLHRVREVPGRAVMVTPEHPAPGVAVQLALEVTAPASAPPAPRRTRRSA